MLPAPTCFICTILFSVYPGARHRIPKQAPGYPETPPPGTSFSAFVRTVDKVLCLHVAPLAKQSGRGERHFGRRFIVKWKAFAFRCVCVAATLQGALLQSNPLTFQILESIIVLSLNASFLEHSVRVASGPNSKHPPPSKDRNGSSLPRNPLSSSWFRCVRATALRIVWGKAGLGRYIEQK
jgi:hypothetical protein